MSSRFEAYFQQSPTLKLLRSNTAALILEFLQATFKDSGLAQIAEEDMEALLEQVLQAGRVAETESLTRDARFYLNLWCEESHQYLQKRFSEEHRSYVYQLTRHSEKALAWMEDLRRGERRGYTTSESRFSRIVQELQRLDRETNSDPELRRAELLARRDVIDNELKQLRETGKVATLDASAIKDALHDLEAMISEFLADFRAIEETFRAQAREIQRLHLERQLSKGDLVEHVLDADEALRSQDQGRSYFGFRQAMVAVENREALQNLANRAADLAAQQGMDASLFEDLLRRLYAEVTAVQSVYRRISAQLRRVVEEQSTRQTQYLMDLLAELRQLAHASAGQAPDAPLLNWEQPLRFNNLMEAALWEAPVRGQFSAHTGGQAADPAQLLAVLNRIGKPLDLPRYRERVATALAEQSPISLRELLERFPPQDGVVDLVAYLVIANENERNVFLPERLQVDLQRQIQPRFAEIQQILFLR